MAKSESTKIEFGYFHDYESEQFAFYRIPKVLFTDEYFRNLSSDAKVLYGLMLDRMALSIRHQWFDEEGKVYIIFTVEQVIQYMNCGRDKAMKTLAELDTKKGIGLIERVKQGFGKPDIIYVKNFILRTSKDVKNNDESEESIQQNREVEEVDLSESEKSTYRGRKNRLQGVGKTDFKRSENTTYRGRKIRTTEVGKIDPINTKYNYTDISNTDRNNTDLINLSDSSEQQSITKLIIPVAIAMIICLIVHPMCMNGEILDWRKLLLFVGIPFGIQKMFLLVVPRNVGTGEMLGLVVLKLMVGSLIGIGVLAWRLLAVAGILLKNGISGIIWIIKRLKEMVIKNERKATGKIVL